MRVEIPFITSGLSEDDLTPVIQDKRIKEALKPFYRLAAEVRRNPTGFHDDRVLYGYNKAEITYGDLWRVIEIYESLPYPPKE